MELQSNDTGTWFAEIILPVPVAGFFTYRVPAIWNDHAAVGMRAVVQFGSKKILTGIIRSLHHQPPSGYEAKYILELLDDNEVISDRQFALYEWMAEYYMCTVGEVVNAALPAGLKLSSESMVQLNPSFNMEESAFDFSEKERMVLAHLQTESMSYSQISDLLGAKSIYNLLRSLTSKEAIILYEQVKEKYKPRTESYLRLTDRYVPKKELEQLFAELSSRPKQEAVVLKYLQDVPVFSDPELNKKGISKSIFTKNDISESSLNTLIKRGVFEVREVVVPRFGFTDTKTDHPILLSEKQEACRNSILTAFEKLDTVLLHGVTGSGKTEVYIDLIRRALDGGSQVLYLLPEIALSTQIVLRLRKIFGSSMGVYHSRFSDSERVEVWKGVLEGRFKFVVGVRSSVFLPFDDLALVIVDEEHDSSYKQYDPAPRYHARDVALMMGRQHKAKVILGSATPSLESSFHATQGHYGLATLSDRFGGSELPEIVFADMPSEKKRKTNKGEFSSLLLKEIGDALQLGEQVIVFQNRRGYSPMTQCQDCGWVPKCINCAVSLTYHQYRHAVICHYCGYREELPQQCPTCSSRRILTLGYGTEKLEEELKLYFPSANVQRMDLDTTRAKGAYEGIIESFEVGTTNILVGTQMVTKGLDFDRVSVVGIFDADRMMHFPDFRSHERAFQLIMQVSGRSGRRNKKGKVIIQTSNREHPLFAFVKAHDVRGFGEVELHDRELYFYPPLSRLIEITVKHSDKKIAVEIANQFTDTIRATIGNLRVMGPGEPMVSKIRNEFLMSILIKVGRDQGRLGEVKRSLKVIEQGLLSQKAFRSARIIFDVDPA